jgi:hypothetical protein
MLHGYLENRITFVAVLLAAWAELKREIRNLTADWLLSAFLQWRLSEVTGLRQVWLDGVETGPEIS